MVENFDPNTIEDEGLRQVVITLMCITPRKILPAGKILTHFLFSSYAASKSLSENLGVCGRIEKNGKEERMSRTKPWEVTDELWKHVQPLIPPAPSHAKGGRPRLPDRQAFEAIV